MVTSSGGVLDAAAVAEAPIHSLGSGPAMAPVAGRFFAERDGGAETAVVADTGGTSYDVSLVRRGRIPWTRETWLGEPFFGHMTGFPSVDVKSIGAGGGSIAWVDEGGLLHVGPESAGSEPGPVCYGRGGDSADGHRCVRSCSATSTRTTSSAVRCGSTSQPRAPRVERAGRRRRSGWRSTRPPPLCCASRPST